MNISIDDIEFWGKNKRNDGGMSIYWSSDIGFGTLDIVKGDDLVAHTETLGRDFVALVLSRIAEQIRIEDVPNGI